MEAPYWLCPWMCIPGSLFHAIECACDDLCPAQTEFLSDTMQGYACMQSDWSIATGLSADSRAYEIRLIVKWFRCYTPYNPATQCMMGAFRYFLQNK